MKAMKILDKFFINKFFIISVLITTFIGYFLNNDILSYFPVVLMVLIVFIIEIYKPSLLNKQDWGVVLSFIPYTIFSLIYYVINPFDGKYISAYSLLMLLLPVYALVFFKFINFGADDFLLNIIRFFLFGQLFVCLGQFSTYYFGIGLPVVDVYEHKFMVSGTFYNPNDLAAILLLITYIIVLFQDILPEYKFSYLWFILFLLIFLTGSRTVIFLSIILFFISRKLKAFDIISIVIVILFFSFFSIILPEDGVLGRLLTRLTSLFDILDSGIRVDESMGLRTQSYIHFINNLSNLGLGSGELKNYFMYSEEAKFDTSLMFVNPHSLIVEIGYWLGWVGLFLFLLPFAYLFFFYRIGILLILIFLVSSSVSSSVLGSPIFFLFLFFCFFIKIRQNLKIKKLNKVLSN